MSQSLAIIRQSYRPDGGAERIIQRLLDGLHQRDTQSLQITLMTQHWQGEADAVSVVKIPKRGWSRAQRFEYFVTDTQALLQQYAFDYIQSHERVPGCQIYRAGDGVHAQWLSIREEHLGWLGRWWQAHDRFHQVVLKAEAELFAHPNLQAVICNSEQVRSEIQHHYPKVDSQKLHLVRNGIDLDHFSLPSHHDRLVARQLLGLNAKAPVLLFVGSGFERKGLQLLLQTCVRLPQYQLVVVGQDKQLQRYQTACKQWGIDGRVKFLGVMSDVRPAYRAADVLVHPAWYDPAPNVVLEAMAMGLPVITSQQCGNKELITEGINGFVLPDHSPKILRAILDTKRDWASLGQAARVTVESYPIERMLDELLAVYEQVLKE